MPYTNFAMLLNNLFSGIRVEDFRKMDYDAENDGRKVIKGSGELKMNINAKLNHDRAYGRTNRSISIYLTRK